jgi:hypothetical protein
MPSVDNARRLTAAKDAGVLKTKESVCPADIKRILF